MDTDLLNGILTFAKKINEKLDRISREQEEIKGLLEKQPVYKENVETPESSFFSLLENEM